MTAQFRLALAVLLGGSLAIGASRASCATINYGDFGPDLPNGVTMYQDVRESSGTDPVPPERFGPPTLSVDTLDFNPVNFSAAASGGGLDITDGQLNFNVMVLELNNVVAGGLTSLLVSESGYYTLGGAGTAATAVAAGVSATVEILEVDGAPITPISMFASNTVVRDLPTDGPAALVGWDNGILLEFGPVLIANNIDFEFGVTKADIVIDDQLIASSETASEALIRKTDFVIEPGIDPNPDFEIPEPASAVLVMALAACVSPRVTTLMDRVSAAAADTRSLRLGGETRLVARVTT